MNAAPPGDHPARPPLLLDLPAGSGSGAPPPRRDRRARRAGSRRGVGIVAVVIGLVVAVALVVEVGLPWYLRRACVAEAASHGIVLDIGDVALTRSGFRLSGVRVSAAALPSLVATADTMDVETTGLRPRKLAVHGAGLTLAGGWSTVARSFEAWRANAESPAGGAWTPPPIVADGLHVTWPGAIGENARVDATDARIDVSWGEDGATFHASSDELTLGVPGGAVGPWRVDIDRAPDNARLRIALDPGVPDASMVLIVAGRDAISVVDVVVPRTPMARLGLAPQLVGLRGASIQLEMNAHYALGPGGRADVQGKGGVYGVDVPGISEPLQIVWEGAASGAPASGLDVKQGRLAVGPLSGAVRGTIRTFDEGFRVDVDWRADAVPCKALFAPLGVGQPFDLAYAIHNLAEAVGAPKITGTIGASGRLVFDSRDLKTPSVDFVPDPHCSVAVFDGTPPR